MAALGTYYFNGLTFSTAIAIYTDANFTTLAPDGYYSDSVVSRRQLNGVLLVSQPCASCSSAACGDAVTVSIAGSGVFNANINLGNNTGAVIIYIYGGVNVPVGMLGSYNGATYNRLTAKDNHNGIILLDGSGATVDYAGVGNQSSGLATYIGNQNASLVGSYTTSPAGACSQGDTPENYTLSGASYTAQGTFSSFSVANSEVGYSSDSSSVASPVFTMVVPKTASTPITLNLKIFAPMCLTDFAWEVACPVNLLSFAGSGAQSDTSCSSNTSTYYFARNATGVAAPFTIDTNVKPETGNWVFTNQDGSSYLNDTNEYQFYILDNSTYIRVRRGVVTAVGDCV